MMVLKVRNVRKLNVIKGMSYDDFERFLLEGEQVYKEQLSFRSIGHRMVIINQRKLALSREDDKRVLCPDYIPTLDKAHYRIG